MELLTEMVVFAKVVDLRSFTRAARELGVTSSAVSRAVSRLEAHMGGKLLHRTTRAVTPTELGEEVHAGCALIAQTARDVRAAAGRHASAPVGRLAVSAPLVFGQRWLAPRIATFLQRWPDVKVQLTLTDRLVDLVEEGLDVAVRIASSLPPGLVARPLTRASFVLVASPAYLKRHGTPRTPADLAKHACVVLGYGDFTGDLHMSDGRRDARVQVSGPMTANNGSVILTAAEAGLGLGLLPDFTAAGSLEAGTLVRVLPRWQMRGAYADRVVHAVYAPTRHVPPKLRVFIDHLAGDG